MAIPTGGATALHEPPRRSRAVSLPVANGLLRPAPGGQPM